MRFQMAPNSLFAILLRSPWWMSAAVALGIGLLAAAALPPRYVPFGVFGAVPFLVIAAIALWRQVRTPSAETVLATLTDARGLNTSEFLARISEALTRQGHRVTMIDVPAADFEAARGGRVMLYACKRWKAANTGIGPLQELYAEVRRREAYAGFYLSGGALSDNARRFARDKGIHVVEGLELAKLLLA
jgi:restriction system protein